MSPIGGLIADRVNKRNIMVILDFLTAGLVCAFVLLYGKASLVTMILILLFMLYGIQGAYQPSVQSGIPLLVKEEKVMTANAVINMVSSLSGLLGPALGGGNRLRYMGNHAGSVCLRCLLPALSSYGIIYTHSA